MQNCLYSKDTITPVQNMPSYHPYPQSSTYISPSQSIKHFMLWSMFLPRYLVTSVLGQKPNFCLTLFLCFASLFPTQELSHCLGLSFCDLFCLNMTPSCFVCLVPKGKISSFLIVEWYSLVYISHIFFMHLCILDCML